jgi:hypothetical protein
MSISPYNCFTSSFVLLHQFPATHIGPNIFLRTFLSQIRKGIDQAENGVQWRALVLALFLVA